MGLRNESQSTRIATGIGRLVALGFIDVGLFRFFNGAGFGDPWLTFIGWFLLDAARSSYLQSIVVGFLLSANAAVMRSNFEAKDVAKA